MKSIPPHTCNACPCILAERQKLRLRVAALEAEIQRLQAAEGESTELGKEGMEDEGTT